jgi:osmotically-inducible protein OsmY
MIADTLRSLSRHAGRQLDRARRRLRRDDPPGDRQTLKDRALARRFRDTFEQDLEMAGVQGLHFYVKEGVVTIYGTVRHELDRELLLSFIRQRPGVEGVVPHLSIEN